MHLRALMVGMGLGFGLWPSAAAAGVGEPIPSNDISLVSLRVSGMLDVQAVRDADCGGRARCDASWERRLGEVQVQIAPINGFAVFGGIYAGEDGVAALDYSGTGAGLELGLRGAVPVGRTFHIAGVVSAKAGRSSGRELLEGLQQSSHVLADVGLVGVLGDPVAGITFWGGAEGSAMARHRVTPLGDHGEASFVTRLAPTVPVQGVLGVAFTSAPMGPPWQRSVAMSIGAEAEAGGTMGLALWIAAHY